MLFYKLPAIICHQGQQMLEITNEHHRAWLTATCISREDLTDDKLGNVFVCEHHFAQEVSMHD